jgi:hypothetical protein
MNSEEKISFHSQFVSSNFIEYFSKYLLNVDNLGSFSLSTSVLRCDDFCTQQSRIRSSTDLFSTSVFRFGVYIYHSMILFRSLS